MNAAEPALDLDAYLTRIGLRGRPSLAEVHRAHVVAIPFENLDPRRGVPVSLALEDIQRKLVTERRGGYCFEHNLLFAAAARELGAEVETMLGRVGPRDAPGRSRSHLALRVRAGGAEWHMDVGFGNGTLLEPIPFGPGGEVVQAGWRRRVVAHGRELVLQSAGADGRWADVYSFVPEPAPLIDLETSNWFTCTHPRSRFVGGLVVTVHHADGTRSALSDWSGTLRLIEQAPDRESAVEVAPGAAGRLLAERFGLPGWALDGSGRPVPEAATS